MRLFIVLNSLLLITDFCLGMSMSMSLQRVKTRKKTAYKVAFLQASASVPSNDNPHRITTINDPCSTNPTPRIPLKRSSEEFKFMQFISAAETYNSELLLTNPDDLIEKLKIFSSFDKNVIIEDITNTLINRLDKRSKDLITNNLQHVLISLPFEQANEILSNILAKLRKKFNKQIEPEWSGCSTDFQTPVLFKKINFILRTIILFKNSVSHKKGYSAYNNSLLLSQTYFQLNDQLSSSVTFPQSLIDDSPLLKEMVAQASNHSPHDFQLKIDISMDEFNTLKILWFLSQLGKKSLVLHYCTLKKQTKAEIQKMLFFIDYFKIKNLSNILKNFLLEGIIIRDKYNNELFLSPSQLVKLPVLKSYYEFSLEEDVENNFIDLPGIDLEELIDALKFLHNTNEENLILKFEDIIKNIIFLDKYGNYEKLYILINFMLQKISTENFNEDFNYFAQALENFPEPLYQKIIEVSLNYWINYFANNDYLSKKFIHLKQEYFLKEPIAREKWLYYIALQFLILRLYNNNNGTNNNDAKINALLEKIVCANQFYNLPWILKKFTRTLIKTFHPGVGDYLNTIFAKRHESINKGLRDKCLQMLIDKTSLLSQLRNPLIDFTAWINNLEQGIKPFLKKDLCKPVYNFIAKKLQETHFFLNYPVKKFRKSHFKKNFKLCKEDPQILFNYFFILLYIRVMSKDWRVCNQIINSPTFKQLPYPVREKVKQKILKRTYKPSKYKLYNFLIRFNPLISPVVHYFKKNPNYASTFTYTMRAVAGIASGATCSYINNYVLNFRYSLPVKVGLIGLINYATFYGLKNSPLKFVKKNKKYYGDFNSEQFLKICIASAGCITGLFFFNKILADKQQAYYII